MAYKLSAANASARASAHNTRMAGGIRRIYAGTVPATADTAITDQTLLVTCQFGTPAFGTPSSGVMTAEAIAAVNAVATGTASFFRDLASDGTTVEGQGTCGASGSGADMILSSTAIVSGYPVDITGITHTQPLSA